MTAVATFPSAALPARAPTNKWLVTVSVSFGTLMGAIDSSIVNVALPHIRGAVGATIQEITWISTGYAIALVLVMPLTAFLARLFGQKRVYMFCLALFIAGSALCGTAGSLTSLVIYRALQGFGAGALQPTEQAILRQTFPAKEQGMAMALFSMAVMLGPALGPTLGGYIVDHYSWPWIFYINVPIGLLGLVMVSSFVQEDEEIRLANRALAAAQRKNIDWQGIALLTIGLSSLQYFLEEGAQDDWFQSHLMTACFVVAMFTLVAFVIRELTAPAPAVNLRLFKDTVFLSGTLLGGVMFAMLMANMFLLPLFMQELLGFSATQSGLALMPRVLVMMAVVPIVGRLYNSVSPRLMIAFGVFMFTVSSLSLSHLTLESGVGDVVSSLLLQGVAFGCLFVPLTTAALSSIPRHLLSDATGLNSLVRQIGGAIGLTLFATWLGNDIKISHAAVSAHVTAVRPEVMGRVMMTQRGLMAHGYDAVSARTTALQALAGGVYRQSMVLAYDHIFLLAGVCFLLCLPLLLFLKVAPIEEGAGQSKAHLE
jgi:DHA2 family multidrug resistance protein